MPTLAFVKATLSLATLHPMMSSMETLIILWLVLGGSCATAGASFQSTLYCCCFLLNASASPQCSITNSVYVHEAMSREHISSAFVDLLAPRIAIGYNQQGHLLILEVNGYEPTHMGVTLHQMAKVALSVGAVDMINLDGGGSVSVVYNKQNNFIANTCSDGCPATGGVRCSNDKCLRAVTSFICIK